MLNDQKSCLGQPGKELSLYNKIKYLNLNIFRTRCCKHLIFQTLIILFNRIHSLKYLRSVTFGSKDNSDQKIRVCGKDSIPLCSQLLYYARAQASSFQASFIKLIVPKYKNQQTRIFPDIKNCVFVKCVLTSTSFLTKHRTAHEEHKQEQEHYTRHFTPRLLQSTRENSYIIV